MKAKRIKLGELMLLVGTRGLLGIGVGLLLSDRLSASQRKAIGLTLVLLGVVSTVPLAIDIFGSGEPAPADNS